MKFNLDSIQENIVSRVASLLEVNPKDIDMDAPFFEIGLSSLDITELMGELEEEWSLEDLELSPMVLFDYPTIASFSAFIAGEMSQSDDVQSVHNEHESDDIAIVGYSCRFPKADNLDEFWTILNEGIDAIEEVTNHPRFAKSFYQKSYAGLINGLEDFDADFFGVKKEELSRMDPQQRLMMELSYLALENAGYNIKDIKGSRTGVFLGISSFDFALETYRDKDKVSIFDGVGGSHSIAANRISYFYDFIGPSMAIDTACSSSLIAIDQAIKSLKSGDSDMAFAGGVNLLFSVDLSETFMKSNMLSPDGKCKTFSKEADGYVRGEGGAFLILKKLSDAQKNDDQILAVIKASATNQDGKTNTITAPSGRSQIEVMQQALKKADLKPSDIYYHEAHGTGTSLGDSIEFDSVNKVHSQRDGDKLKIGSVKTNIGHLEAASGMAGIVKILLCYQHNKLVKQLHFNELNPNNLKKDRFIEVQSKHLQLPQSKSLPMSVSSFGFGGTNAHLILDRYECRKEEKVKSESHYLTLSAPNERSLELLKTKFIDFVKTTTDPLNAINLKSHQRVEHRQRNAFYAKSKDQLIQLLEKSKKSVQSIKKATVAFLFSGQGSQYLSMGKDLYEQDPLYRRELDRCINYFQPHYEIDLRDVLFGRHDKSETLLQETEYAQIFIFSIQFALLKRIDRLGVKADVVIGHSLGEIAASLCAGILDESSAFELVLQRAKAMQKSPKGKMLNVFESEQTVLSEIKFLDLKKTSIAAVNGSKLVMVSGETDEVLKLESRLKEKKIKTKLMKVQQAFHSVLMEEVLPDFEKNISKMKFHAPKVKMISTLKADFIKDDSVSSRYWVEQIRKPTLFYPALKLLEKEDVDIFIEIGSHSTLLTLTRYALDVEKSKLIPLLEKNKNETFDESIGRLWELGLPVHFSSDSFRAIGLPLTPLLASKPLERILIQTETLSTKTVISKESSSLQDITKRVLQIINDHTSSTQGVKLDDELMSIGGDSLELLTVLDYIEVEYKVKIAITDLFETVNTLRKVCEYVYSHQENLVLTNLNTDVKMNKIANLQESSKGVLGNFNSIKNSSEFNIEDDNKKKYIENLIASFSTKRKSSKSLTQQYRAQLADNRTSAGFRPNLKEIIFPIHSDEAHGSQIIDVDGNTYIDLTMGFGVNFFGHSPDFIQTEVSKQLRKGVVVGPQSPSAGENAQLLCELTNNDRACFLNSGTEAVMTAVRLARAFTKKNLIVVFEGSYHGHFDGVLAKRNSLGDIVPVAPGVTHNNTLDILVLDYNDDTSIDIIKEYSSNLAAVIVEPVQSRYPEIEPKDFLTKLRKVTQNGEIALIFDEVITGFRFALGGAAEYFDVEPDLSTYGKVLGGGFPIGAVAGKKKYLDFIDGGFWEFGTKSSPYNEQTFFAGTFCKHPMAMAATKAVLKKMKAEGNVLISEVNKNTEKLVGRLNKFFENHSFPIKMVSQASLFRFKFVGNIDWLILELIDKGLYIWEGRNLFLSTAHTQDDLVRIEDIIKESCLKLFDIGYIKPSDNSNVSGSKTELLDGHRRFSDLALSEDLADQSSAQISLSIFFHGKVNKDSLSKSFHKVVSRHKSLGAVYDLKNNTVDFSQKKNNCLIEFKDIHESDLESQKNTGANFLLCPNERPLILSILSIGPNKHYIALRTHHLVMDGVSIAFFTEELAKFYSIFEGETKKVNKVYDFEDYMNDLNKKVMKMDQAKLYWDDQMRKLPDLIFTEHEKRKGARVRRVLDESLSKKLRMFGYKNKSSFLMTLLWGFSRLVKEEWNRDEFSIGLPCMGHPSIKHTMIGNCVNLIPLIIRNQDKENFMSEMKTQQMSSFRYSELPENEIFRTIDRKHHFDMVFNVEPISELPKFSGNEISMASTIVNSSEYPLMFNVLKLKKETQIEMDFQLSLFSKEKAERLLDQFIEILTEMES